MFMFTSKRNNSNPKSYEIKRIGCKLPLEMINNEKILCLDYKLEKMNKQNDF